MQELISCSRVKLWLIKMTSWTHDGEVQPGVLGQGIIFPESPRAAVKLLPPSVQSVQLRVLFLGRNKPNRKTVAKLLGVRIRKVWKALQWLKKHNAFYFIFENLTIHTTEGNRASDRQRQ